MTPATDITPPPMTDIHDIKPLLVIGSQWPWWVWLIGALLLLSAAAWIVWRRRRLVAKDQPPSEPLLPPDTMAFRELDLLAATGRSDPKQFYFSLSAILRQYAERRFGFPAAEMTTEEFLDDIRKMALSDALRLSLAQFCRNSDPIKFADAKPDATGMSRDLAFVRQFVQQTTTVQVTEENNNGAPKLKAANPTQPKRLPSQQPLPERSLQTNHQTPNTKH
jgi:hypothetical protein